MKKRIIIDTDMGSDDFIAISLAALSNKFNIEGITLVSGNTTIENAKRNILKTLNIINKKKQYKVYCGDNLPIKNYDVNTNDFAHGDNGFGGVSFDDVEGSFEEKSASDYLIDCINKNPHKISIVCIGPLTNIAKAIIKDKNFSRNVKELIIMGGAENSGNITPYAEFNFYKDPIASKTVFEAGIKKILMIGFNITKKITIDCDLEKRLLSDGEIGKFLYDISRTCAKIDREKNGTDGATINDAINICYLINKSVLKTRNAYVEINTDKCEKLGESKIYYKRKSNCKVAVDINKKKCKDIIFNTILIKK